MKTKKNFTGMLSMFVTGVLLFALFSCEKEDVVSIKQYKIDLFTSDGNFAGSGIGGERLFETSNVYFGFNKNNYKGCKSIVFNASITAAISLETYTSTDTCYLDLYNLTDRKIIPNSTITTHSPSPEWVTSDDIMNEFPDKDIDLTILLRRSAASEMSGVYSASLYINF